MSVAHAAEIRVFSGGAPQSVLRTLAPVFEKATGHTVVFSFQIVGQIQKRLAAGEQADLILLPNPLLAEIGKTVPLRAEGRGVLARIGIGVVVRAGAALPDISTEDDVRKMLRGAKAVALADPHTPSGRYLGGMLMRLGLADEMRSRLIYKGAIHGGGELVASGEAEVGLYLVSEVQQIKGVAVAGLLPPALQNHVAYGAAIPVSNAMPEPALALIRFLAAPERAVNWRQAGFEPGGAP
jgi:molybdate transport system substrate-binding protein